jgi:hypothetical protein
MHFLSLLWPLPMFDLMASLALVGAMPLWRRTDT